MLIKEKIKSVLPWPAFFFLRKLRSLPEDLPILLSFFFHKTTTPTKFIERLKLTFECYRISYFVDSAHMENEIIQVISAILSLDPLSEAVIVEAGSYKGGSTSKLSLAAQLAHRKLVVFDSFQGLPKHHEVHKKNIFGGDAYFPPGSYAGSLDEVSKNITQFGSIDTCQFKKGWFEDTMPGFNDSIGIAYIDVDLESSTRTCIKYLYPLLIPGGILFSQDGHLPWVIKLLSDHHFWNQEVRCGKPEIYGLGEKKLFIIKKIK